MKRLTQTMLALGLAVSVVACGADNAADEQAANRERPAAGGDAVGTTGAGGARDFIQDQLEDGTAEVTLGKLAAERAAHPEVKEFAQMMVREHQMAGEELRQAATAANLQLETPQGEETNRDHKNAQEELMKLNGPEFDKKYMDLMVEEHEEAVSEIEKQTDTENAEVRRWAAKTLPKVRQHLEHARQLQQTLEQAGDKK